LNRLIKADADPAVAVLVSPDVEIGRDTLKAAESMIMFHMEALAESIQSPELGSVILDLLLQWRPESVVLAARCPALHHALLTLMHAHCSRSVFFFFTH